VKDPTVYPAWSAVPTLPASMQGQAQAFFSDVLGRQGGTVSALLTSPTVFVNQDLGGYYGVSGGDATFQSVPLPAGQTSGLLTLPALLTLMAKPDQPWPIYRGEFVREELLCQQLPSPPPNIPAPPAVEMGVSVRQRLSEHETNPACSGCHHHQDPDGPDAAGALLRHDQRLHLHVRQRRQLAIRAHGPVRARTAFAGAAPVHRRRRRVTGVGSGARARACAPHDGECP
jgi:hypothetical protein